MRSLVVCSVLLSILTLAASRNNNNTGLSTNKQTYVEVLHGRDGRDGVPGRDGVKGERGDKGEKGEKGETGPVGQAGPKSGGVVYTRWGRKSCPTGAELLYEGITGGNHNSQTGGGANYVCLPKVPQYLSTTVPSSGQSYMYGTEYEVDNRLFPGNHDHNAPCAVCYTSTKSVKLMIPARTSCPSSWTIEYKGYLMTQVDGSKNSKVYECVDENPESIDGSKADTDGALFYFTASTCNGLPCPPYVNDRAITCVVCTK
ncbi:PREDICTED: short-chain collagen C4-like isoform X1 [Amphimedon queenslandica]|uniref:Short-chain collagen C4-like n=1 Tax=Amphimedon queenslandica TaxID=400682 RepID=A0AAN0J145_AMPQE|nr:PREDICTED: short-chain collagen C4-like isoform X1 [Amphimedon queenslandica]|eukprot:XP_019850451.1 PREDICTED: short-chain collagen C4-like isoform X1 [Amphimedon queenslandica]